MVPVLVRLVALDDNVLSALLAKAETEVRVVEIVVLEKGGSLVVITVVDEESPSLDVSDKVVAVVPLLVGPLIVVPEEGLAVRLAVEVGLGKISPLVVEDVRFNVELEVVVSVVLRSALMELSVAVMMLLPDEEKVIASMLWPSLELGEGDGVERFENKVEEEESEDDNDVGNKVEEVAAEDDGELVAVEVVLDDA
ncbi:hypothetical protein CFIO01_06438 [Colletotrichum fioriniae PJ7]|uniref:Uncharacterized protein n=1 Tax=Colletotrichum fioriniae PJ7 TaxID=1445577 RepID=A0A010RFG4_9PEZI|nr:hypothetical protein CFIO01_06438 [Colletotrichum fioriniae PJ7]